MVRLEASKMAEKRMVNLSPYLNKSKSFEQNKLINHKLNNGIVNKFVNSKFNKNLHSNFIDLNK